MKKTEKTKKEPAKLKKPSALVKKAKPQKKVVRKKPAKQIALQKVIPVVEKVPARQAQPPKKKVLPRPAKPRQEKALPEVGVPSIVPIQIIKPTIEEPVRVKEKPAKKPELPIAEVALPEKKIPEFKEAAPAALKQIELQLPISVKDVAVKLQEKSSQVIKTLMNMGVMAGINQVLDDQTVTKLCQKYGYAIKKAPDKEESALAVHQEKDLQLQLRPRAPIVTLMGHVDHGKTSLLDAIRKSKVVDSEHGGITQHIGAYRVSLAHGDITFLDTPGHEAFTAMRARGARITDIVVLVVAADDGVMPQTEEAIDHARAAEVSIIVAINKIDKPQAQIDQVKKQLSKLGFTPEDWSGKTITVPVSAKTGQGIDDLLEMILLEAQILELKANPNRLARGVVIEAKVSKAKGPVVTLLVENGTLRLNDNIIVGPYYGKIRAMFNDRAESVQQAGPSFPVEALGISQAPEAGEQFFVIEDERVAKELAAKRLEKQRQQQLGVAKKISLEDLHTQIKEGKLKELKLIIKADVQGSLGAITDTIRKISTPEININIIHQGVGAINASDVILAAASNALVIGFNVTADTSAKELTEKEGVDLRVYNIIYELAAEIKAALEGMLEPKLKKTFLGRLEVRKVFKLSRSGTVAGCFVTKGKITRSSFVSLVRNAEPIFEGQLSSLKRFKDDVREVSEGFECGVTLSGFEDFKEADIIEAYEIEKIARKL